MLTTELTKVFGIRHPVVLAGMGEASGPALVAAVSNAGGLGVLGGALYSPKQLQELLDEVKVCGTWVWRKRRSPVLTIRRLN